MTTHGGGCTCATLVPASGATLPWPPKLILNESVPWLQNSLLLLLSHRRQALEQRDTTHMSALATMLRAMQGEAIFTAANKWWMWCRCAYLSLSPALPPSASPQVGREWGSDFNSFSSEEYNSGETCWGQWLISRFSVQKTDFTARASLSSPGFCYLLFLSTVWPCSLPPPVSCPKILQPNSDPSAGSCHFSGMRSQIRTDVMTETRRQIPRMTGPQCLPVSSQHLNNSAVTLNGLLKHKDAMWRTLRGGAVG